MTDSTAAGDGGAPEADRIERDLARTRARIDATIDALQDKLAPGQVVDQAVAYLKGTGGGEFGRNMMVAVRDNPIPVALVGIGIAWLVAANAIGAERGRARGRRDEAVDRYARAGGYARARERYRGDRAGPVPMAPPPAPRAGVVGVSGTAGEVAGGIAEGARRAAGGPGGDGGGADADSGGARAYEPGLEGPLARREGYLTQRGAYASAAADDLATKANAAGTAVRRDPGEAEDAYQGRVYAAKGAVLGLRRDEGEAHAGFRDRVEAALVAAAERHERARRGAGAGAVGGNFAVGGGRYVASRERSRMDNVSGYGRAAADYGRSAAEGAYGYGQAAAEAVYGYGRGAARNVGEHPLAYALIGAGIAGVALYLMSGRSEEERRRRPSEAMRYYAGGGGPGLAPPGRGPARYDSDSGYGDDRYAYQADRRAGYGATTGGGYGVAGAASAGYGRAGGAGYGGVAGYAGAASGYDRDAADMEPVEDLASRAHAAGASVGRADDEDEEAYGGRVYAARGKELGLAQNAGETLAAFRERVDAALATAGERYARWRDQAASALASAGGRAAAGGRGAADALYGYGRAAGRAGGSAAGYVQEQPWLMALLGFGAGAVLAMLAPTSRYERELARDAGGDLGDRLRDAAGDVMEGAGRVAREVAGAARGAAEREGLTGLSVPSAGGLARAARGRVQDAAERVRHVVEETAAAGRAAVERELRGEGGDGGGTGTATGEGRDDEAGAQIGGGGGAAGDGDEQRRRRAGGSTTVASTTTTTGGGGTTGGLDPV